MKVNYIPLDECKHGFLYRIQARNFRYGVFNKDTNGFVGIRYKFEYEYLFTEYHWDTGEPFGTVMPVELLEECPITDLTEGKFDNGYIENTALAKWLEEKRTIWENKCL